MCMCVIDNNSGEELDTFSDRPSEEIKVNNIMRWIALIESRLVVHIIGIQLIV